MLKNKRVFENNNHAFYEKKYKKCGEVGGDLKYIQSATWKKVSECGELGGGFKTKCVYFSKIVFASDFVVYLG